MDEKGICCSIKQKPGGPYFLGFRDCTPLGTRTLDTLIKSYYLVNNYAKNDQLLNDSLKTYTVGPMNNYTSTCKY